MKHFHYWSSEWVMDVKIFIKKLLDNVVVNFLNLLPDKLRIQIHENNRIIRTMDYSKQKIYLWVDSEFEYKVRLSSCEKEPETVDWIEKVIKPGDVMYDIGANVGVYSLVAAKFFAGRVKIFALEPAFTNFTNLCKNIYINNCQDIIVPLQIALSDETVVKHFNYRTLTPGGSLHSLGEPLDQKGRLFKPIFKHPILCYRLDDLITQFDLPIPNHIKIDVDGNELDILRGARNLLQNKQVQSIIMEVNEDGRRGAFEDFINFLQSMGFTLDSKHPYSFRGNASQFATSFNCIFKKEKCAAGIMSKS